MMKKILFYIDTLGKGGLDKVVLDVANNIDFKKYDVTVMRRFPGGYYSDFLDKRIHKKAQNKKRSRLYKQNRKTA